MNGWSGSVGIEGGCLERIDFSIDGFSSLLNFSVEVPDEEWALADIVPLAGEISEKMIEESLASLNEQGCQISCRKGCSTCCNYFIPVSIPEIFYLNRQIAGKSTGEQRDVIAKCLSSATRMMNDDSPDFCDSDPDSRDALEKVSQWYERLDMACPFLENHSCSIYEDRPFSCREHFMTGSSQICSSPDGAAEPVEMSLNISNALAVLTSQLEGSEVEGVALPLFYVWCHDSEGRGLMRWPAKEMIQRFVDIVREMAAENALVLSGEQS